VPTLTSGDDGATSGLQLQGAALDRATWELAFGSVWLFDRVHQRIACHTAGPSATPTEHL
jgi:hypothetical protein